MCLYGLTFGRRLGSAAVSTLFCGQCAHLLERQVCLLRPFSMSVHRFPPPPSVQCDSHARNVVGWPENY
jgi:hypothetical protein